MTPGTIDRPTTDPQAQASGPADVPPSDPAARADEVRRIAVDVATRLSAGQSVDIEQVVAEHLHLMPELGDELRVQVLTHRESMAARPSDDALADSGWAMVKPDDAEPGVGILQELGCDTGLVVAGKAVVSGYRVTGPGRRGGQATVYQAKILKTDRTVAVKVLSGGAMPGRRRLLRMAREIRILARLNHPNIVGVIDSGRTVDQSYFLAMNYVEGPELDAWVRGRPVGDVLGLFAKVFAAAGDAHQQGVVHRDLKPSNVRVDGRGEPHLLDFGLARLADEADDPDDPAAAPAAAELVTKEGHVVGSLPWLSPEQAAGQNGRVDARSDVYALGVMLYESLTGRPPYARGGTLAERLWHIHHHTPDPPSRRARVSKDVDAVVMKALAKDPAARYADAAEMAVDLLACVRGRAVSAPPYRRPRRVPAVVAAAAAAAIAVAVAMVLVITFGGGGDGTAGGPAANGGAPPLPPIAATAPVVPTGVVTLKPTMDAYVRAAEYGYTKFGELGPGKELNYRHLQVKTLDGVVKFSRDAYIEFDLGAVPTKSSVRSARLRLHGLAIRGDTLDPRQGYTLTVGVYALADPEKADWRGTSITWANRPFLDGWQSLARAKGQLTVGTVPPQWNEADLTAFVRGEHAAGRRKFTVGLHVPASVDMLAQFSSAETANAPTLVIDYGPP